MAEAFDNLPDESQLQAPKALRDDLAALYGGAVPVPPAVDAAVVATGRRIQAIRRRTRSALRWAGVAAAAAAAIFLLAIHLGPAREPAAPAPQRPAPAVAEALPVFNKADINRDGRVDILDAFLLAKRLVAGRKPKPEWDFDGDGLVDRRDVDALAAAAVRLEREAYQ